MGSPMSMLKLQAGSSERLSPPGAQSVRVRHWLRYRVMEDPMSMKKIEACQGLGKEARDGASLVTPVFVSHARFGVKVGCALRYELVLLPRA